MKLTEKDVVANMVLILFMLWSEPFFGQFVCLLILFKHFLDVLFSPATSAKGWHRIISTSICSWHMLA